MVRCYYSTVEDNLLYVEYAQPPADFLLDLCPAGEKETGVAAAAVHVLLRSEA